MVALLVVLTILFFLTLDYFVQRAALGEAASARQGVTAGAAAAIAPPSRAARAARLIPDPLPDGILFDAAHTWLQRDAGGGLRVGADAMPALLLGEITDIDLAAPGQRVRRGDPIAMLAGGKRTLTLRAPVDGVIAAANPEAALDPSLVASDPFGSGWLVRLDAEERPPALERLVQGEAAAVWARRELGRLRAFLTPAGPGAPVPVGATLHDGGEPLTGLAGRLDREAWEWLESAFFLPAPEEPDRLSERYVDPYSLGDARSGG